MTVVGLEPFLVTGRSAKTSKASWVSESGESSITGISTRYLGWLSFLSFLVGRGIGLLRGFLRVVERESFAWEMASSLVVGGSEQQYSGLRREEMPLEQEKERGEGEVVVCKWSLSRLEMAIEDHRSVRYPVSQSSRRHYLPLDTYTHCIWHFCGLGFPLKKKQKKKGRGYNRAWSSPSPTLHQIYHLEVIFQLAFLILFM